MASGTANRVVSPGLDMYVHSFCPDINGFNCGNTSPGNVYMPTEGFVSPGASSKMSSGSATSYPYTYPTISSPSITSKAVSTSPTAAPSFPTSESSDSASSSATSSLVLTGNLSIDATAAENVSVVAHIPMTHLTRVPPAGPSPMLPSQPEDGPQTHTSPILPANPYSSTVSNPDASSISSAAAVSAPSSPSYSTSTSTSLNKHSDHTGAIVGGVIGGLALFLLITVGTILLRRRLRARRTAPSAEFMDIARGTTPGRTPTPGFVRVEGTTTPSGDRFLPLARQGSLGDDRDDERPPMFTPGAYTDPVFEKVRVAAAMREEYEGRGSLAHEEESMEEGYGANGDEKVGQYTWAM